MGNGYLRLGGTVTCDLSTLVRGSYPGWAVTCVGWLVCDLGLRYGSGVADREEGIGDYLRGLPTRGVDVRAEVGTVARRVARLS